MAEVMWELEDFARKNNLSIFNKNKTSLKLKESIFKTADARTVYNKVLAKISQNFCFSDTSCLFQYFYFSDKMEDIKRRQEFFRNIGRYDNNFLRSLKLPRQTWEPKYEAIVVTENEDTFVQLKDLGCPVKYISSSEDIHNLEDAEVVQVIDCDNFMPALEQLPQTVFLNSIDEVYLERFLENLSGWSENLKLIDGNANEEISSIVHELEPFFHFFSKSEKKLSRDSLIESLEIINSEILEEVKNMTLSGNSLVDILSRSKLPDEFRKVVELAIKRNNLPGELFIEKIPVELDEKEVDRYLRENSAGENTKVAESIKKNSKELRLIPQKLARLDCLLLIFDFIAGVSKFISQFSEEYPLESNYFIFEDSRNIFLENPQPISFLLNEESRCSILTGANSGGKTTLIEHIIQLISLFQLGLPVLGKVRMPLFSDVYYFAKNKGSMSRGAFETLLTQMAGIKLGKKTLILADEMEAVTEPGVAASIVCSTAEFFISRGCFLVIATHLGQEIVKILPKNSRVDGIEAKGLDEKNELIVNHNPVLGRLANSTPELIVERLANKEKTDYFIFLNERLKKR
jgi:DNA mismatch repair protein MutS2